MSRQHVAFTIVTKSYLAGALVWKKSIEEKSPGIRAFIFVTDLKEQECDCLNSEVQTIAPDYVIQNKGQLRSLESVDIHAAEEMAQRYSAIEFCTAIKPSLFISLSKEFPSSVIHYFDPDILVYGSMRELLEFSERHSFTLIPHIQTPTDDSKRLGVLDIMRAGVFNFGYLAWNHSFQSGLELMAWWKKQLVTNCRVALSDGIFVDQSWGVLFCCSPDSGIFHSKSYNVAYWNLHERFISCSSDGHYSVNGAPLEFFHFSGFEFEKPEQLSIHQNRHFLPGNRVLTRLFSSYSGKLRDAGIIHWRSSTLHSEPGDDEAKPNETPSRRELAKAHTEWYIQAITGNPYNSLVRSSILWNLFYPLNLLVMIFFGPTAKKLPRVTVTEKLQKKGTNAVNRLKNKKRNNYLHLSLIYWTTVLKGLFSSRSGNDTRCQYAQTLQGCPSCGVAPAKNKSQGAAIALTGYLTAEMGVGESARGIARAFDHSGIPADLFDIGGHYARSEDSEYAGRVASRVGNHASYEASILCVNADQVVQAMESQPGMVHTLSERRIGYWYWETENFPSRYLAATQYFDEIWVATSFVGNALQNAGIKKPIRIIPPSLPHSVRSHLQFPKNDGGNMTETNTTFLCIFDATSIMGRKNPAGAIELMRKVQQSTGINPTLILKTTHLGEANKGKLLELGRGLQIKIIDQYLSRSETMSLISSADCYVSLHRSEGLGLSLIDAMRLGTPLLATDYSGPVDFANYSNAWMVPWTYTDASWEDGPYYGARWAEPDLDAACAKIISIFEDKSDRLLKTKKARNDVEYHFSSERITGLIMEALK